jgi:hypothetical protein
VAETSNEQDDKIDSKEKKATSPAGGFQPMIGAARVMAAVHAPRMDAVHIKRGIPSILSVAPTIPEEVRQREGSEHGNALSGTPLSGQVTDFSY